MSKKLSDNIHIYYKIMEIHYRWHGGVDIFDVPAAPAGTLVVPDGPAGTLMYSKDEALNTIKELLLTTNKQYTIVEVYC
jgi:hypothetical protein